MSLAVALPEVVPALSVVRVLVLDQLESIVATPVPVLELDFGGVVGDRHHGITRPSSSRELRFYPRGTLIRNRRQVTLVSAEELAEIARRLQVPEVRAEWLGANLLVTGSGELSRLPVGSRLVFSSGVTLVCEGINQPCRLPAQVLHRHYPEARALSRFVPAAMGRRGVVATVEHPGTITRGDGATVTPPEPYASFG